MKRSEMPWFRWWNDTATDMRLQAVARRAKCPIAIVLDVWVVLQEKANKGKERGVIDNLDFESIDVALGLDDGQAATVYAEMVHKGLMLHGGAVADWDEKQAKREREDDSADRVAAHRARKKASAKSADTPSDGAVTPGFDDAAQSRPQDGVTEEATPSNAESHQVTPSNATSRPREEESREDINTPLPPTGGSESVDKFKESGDSVDKPNMRGGTAQVQQGWEAFKAAWPVQVGMVKALRRWEFMAPDPVLTGQIVAAVKAWALSRQWTQEGGRFVPRADRWLRDRGWLDQVPQAQGAGVHTWWETPEGIKTRGAELGLPFSLAALGNAFTDDARTAHWRAYRAEVFKAAGQGPWRAAA